MEDTNKHFCMAPWVHMHMWPNGNIYPCCTAPSEDPYGNTNTESLEDVWNGQRMRELRVNMLADKPSKSCNRCYKLEEHGSFSMRSDMNQKFAHRKTATTITHSDGHHPEMKMRYMDIRFSNICNFKCRSCGPELSSLWYDDQVILHGKPDGKRIVRPFKTETELWANLEKILPYVEEVYFAGGEPLVHTEHYQVLDYLVDNGKTDVRLVYNTNFSKTRFKGKDIFDYWAKFSDVNVGASLDASGKRAEYMRAGTNWAEIEKNRIELQKRCPHVSFFIAATVSLYNGWHLPDFYLDWLNKGFSHWESININILHHPAHLSLTVLPAEIKEQITKKYERAIAQIPPEYREFNRLASVVDYMNSRDDSHMIPEFFARNDKLDEIRSEEFVTAFPELKPMLKYKDTINEG
jgi:radical SAM protein with 4Fe4S-binding SPASM domain